MKNKKIVVLLKYFKGELNPFDGAALECALESGANEVIAITMAPFSALEAFKSITRLGAKGIFISDSAFAGSDTQATSYVLAEAIARLSPDIVFCGRQSIDGDTAQVPPMLAERLKFNIKTKVIEFSDGAILLRNGERTVIEDRTIYTFERIKTLRFPSIFSKVGEVEIWDNRVLSLPLEKCGLAGSPTRVVRSYESSVGRRNCVFTTLERLPALIEDGLKKELVISNTQNGELLDEVYYVGNVKGVAESIAKKAIAYDESLKSARNIADDFLKSNVKTVLWEDSEELKILASRVAVLTGAGLCADCISFRVENGKFIMTRPAQGGNITADIISTSTMAFATVRTANKVSADVIFSVGKGAADHIDSIRALAEKYNAELCCSRIVTDSGKMPYTSQVGLTGRIVSPKVYVAFGISGAVQHTCAISGAGTVISLNLDKRARIFDYSDYGIIIDLKDFEVLQ